MNQIRKRLTYSNVMSTIAVFFVVAGGTAFAASQLGKETVGSRQLKKEAVTTAKIKKGAVTGSKLAAGAVGASNINTSGLTVPNATHADKADKATSADTASSAGNALALGGKAASNYYGRGEILWAIVTSTGTLLQGSGAVSASRPGTGEYRVVFNRNITTCTTIGSSLDAGGGAAPIGNDVRIVTTDSVNQATEEETVNVAATNPAGELKNAEAGDGIGVTVIC